MTEPLEIPSKTLLQLAEALEAGHVRGPLTKFGLRAFTMAKQFHDLVTAGELVPVKGLGAPIV